MNNCFSTFSIVLILYSFYIIEGFELDSDSKFIIDINRNILLDVVYKNTYFKYHIFYEKINELEIKYYLEIIDNTINPFVLENQFKKYVGVIKNYIPKCASINGNNINFNDIPTKEEQNVFRDVFKNEKEYVVLNRSWRKLVTDYFQNINNHNKKKKINIVPLCYNIKDNVKTIENTTNNLFNSTPINSFFLLPIKISSYKEIINNQKIINRLYNYGERFVAEDAKNWGNYGKTILPILLEDINSIQRIIKFISITTATLLNEWHSEDHICPLCGKTNCDFESDGSYFCDNCNIIFGLTKDTKVCGEYYFWIKPKYHNVKYSEFETENLIELMLKKEKIFDNLTVTNFDIIKNDDGMVKFTPICPKCGGDN